MDLAANQISHEREAGFVPPLVQSISSAASNFTVTVTTSTQQGKPFSAIRDRLTNLTSAVFHETANADVKPWLGVSVSQSGSPPTTQRTRRLSVGSNSSNSDSSYSSSTAASYTSHRRGGRDDIVGEDAGKRLMRRERNKQAAARCRKRRLDHTMALQQETELWDDKKQHLQNEIRQLQKEKEELELLLESHQPACKMRKLSSSHMIPPMPNLTPIPPTHVMIIKEESNDSFSSENSQLDPLECSQLDHRRVEFTRPPAPRPLRPTSLPVFTNQMRTSSAGNWNEIAGIAITTPSSGIPGFNFDSLMEGGTGLTPVVPSPSCSTQQQRSSAVLPVDLSSPEAVNRKLVSL